MGDPAIFDGESRLGGGGQPDKTPNLNHIRQDSMFAPRKIFHAFYSEQVGANAADFSWMGRQTGKSFSHAHECMKGKGER